MTTPTPDAPDWAAAGSAVSVPNLIATVTLTTGQTSGLIDVSGYASFFVAFKTVNGIYAVDQFVDRPGGGVSSVGGAFFADQPVPINCIGRYITVENTGGASPETFGVYGYPRQSINVSAVRVGWQAQSFTWSTGSVAMTAGIAVGLTSTSGQLFQGPAYVMLEISGSTVTGIFRADGVDSGDIFLGDTTETHAAPTGNRIVYKTLALPPDIIGLDFFPSVGGTANVVIQATPNY